MIYFKKKKVHCYCRVTVPEMSYGFETASVLKMLIQGDIQPRTKTSVWSVYTFSNGHTQKFGWKPVVAAMKRTNLDNRAHF